MMIRTIQYISITISIFLSLYCTELSYSADLPEKIQTEKECMDMARYMDTLLSAESSIVKTIENSSFAKAKTLLRMARVKKKTADEEINQKKCADAIKSLKDAYSYIMEAAKIATASSREEKMFMDEIEEGRITADFYIIAAERVTKDTKNADALKSLQDAKDARLKAEEDIKVKNYKSAIENLDASASFARQAIALAGSGKGIRDESLKEKDKKDAERRVEILMDAIRNKIIEVDTLISAAERLVEKENDKEAKELLKSAEEKREIALGYNDKGEYENAIENLKEAYYLVARSIKKMRQGRIVVHAVTFEDVREEFAYEKGRNETYLLLAYSLAAKNDNKEAQKLIDEANAIKEKADDAAKNERYTEAIKDIWASTNLIVKALEMMGFKP